MKRELFDRGDKPLKIIAIYLILIIFVIFSVYPIITIVSVALRPATGSAYSTSLALIPDHATFDNFKDAFIKYDLGRWLLNSAFVSILATIFGVALSVTAGYAFSRFNFKGKNTGLTMLLVTQMFPISMMLLPMYLLLIKFQLTNYTGLIIVYVSTAIPFNIWMMKGYYDTIPTSFEESAYIDGAGIFRSFYQIILPLAKPAVALCALFSFMGAWSEFITARVLITNKATLTLPVGLVSLQGQFSTDWSLYSAAALITAIPVMIIFVSLSKYLVGGLTLGGVKG